MPNKPHKSPVRHPSSSNRKAESLEIKDMDGNLLASKQELYSGPLPPASELVKYQNIQNDFPERILKMAETDLAHIQLLQKVSVITEAIASLAGIISAWSLGIFTIYKGAEVAMNGGTIEGSILAGVGLAGILGVFIYGTRRKANNSVE